jgi:hypothetical protein
MKWTPVIAIIFGPLIAMLIYFGIGAVFHALLVGAQFDWSSAWTWGTVLAWPAIVFLFGIAFVFCLYAVVFVCLGIMWVFER